MVDELGENMPDTNGWSKQEKYVLTAINNITEQLNHIDSKREKWHIENIKAIHDVTTEINLKYAEALTKMDHVDKELRVELEMLKKDVAHNSRVGGAITGGIVALIIGFLKKFIGSQ